MLLLYHAHTEPRRANKVKQSSCITLFNNQVLKFLGKFSSCHDTNFILSGLFRRTVSQVTQQHNYTLYGNFLHNTLQSNDMGQLSVCHPSYNIYTNLSIGSNI
ncbi:MAG: hypothetical protein EWV48_07805 [Microcystis aeruginosa Ma_QC_C_20070823_S13]|nr:MAG: hypothetical protein EWV48_07805 [Microcystis aeruginosa Ma_QC_C_20070823_S13]TRU63899.1 MAG: hypothetical protein EWV56_04190 [Microcystis aeruginosa Ma_QC_C_20070823_S13D]